MYKVVRTNSNNKDFVQLVAALDSYLAVVDGDDHAFYDQFNKIASLNHVVVVYHNELAVACGAIKEYTAKSMEVKRMFTLPEFRGNGLAQKVVSQLEQWAKKLGYTRCLLETGVRQVEAIGLYKKIGYTQIENYGQYKGVQDSLCFEKQLNKIKK